ncbi:amidohydrolase [Flagellimonas allohymeniacidonis]|uniref:Omega-amidase YafV n=1 Tax=Flagellimonas allohymeniacidonis TaxID=2517819 RepID=A0A4Q8QGS5_9FLAO|nr:amidohydrolase [Allomuricauda hymeniacidonis]TAI47803.1 amidohydrolase [Allomuricauda hymeniacidonis]
MDKLKIALVQSHLHWENPEANRSMFEAKIKSMPETVDLVILPEMFTTGFTMKPQNIEVAEGEKTVDWMQNLARETKTAITGSIVFSEKEKFFNRLFFVEPNGNSITYDKKHTFTLAGEDQVYEAGSKKITIEFKGFRFSPLICYDLRFPVWSRNVDDYDVLFYVANWPKPRIAAWDTLLKARAIENMAYCIGVNRVGLDGLGYEYPGHTAAYDTLGNQLAFSNKEEILYVELDREHIFTQRNKLKFLQDRDRFNLQG